jgi:replicative DNA helicase
MEGSAPAPIPFGGEEKRAAFRTPPHNFEAEMAVLGAILTNNRAFEQVSEFLRKEHFADPRHGKIFAAIEHLRSSNQLADPITLKNYFEGDGTLDQIGGASYLARLAASIVSVVNAADYGRIVHDRFLRRELISIGEDIVNGAYDVTLEESATDRVEAAEQSLFNLASEGTYQRDFKTFTEALKAAVDVAEAAHGRGGGLAGVPTFLKAIDHKLGGLHPSDLIILAGRPGMGKTALATKFALNAARGGPDRGHASGQGTTVAFFSLEMSAEQLATRIIAEEIEVSSDKIRRGAMKTEDFTRVVEASHTLSRIPLFIDDTAGVSVPQLRTRARRLKRQHNLGLIVIDYLQLLRGPAGQRQENRVQELSEITRSLKILAKELHVPVVALSQLSRAVEARDDKRPQLADLRESGSIEQDADVVLFIYREEYYLKNKEPPPEDKNYPAWVERMEKHHNKADVIIAKQRHGPTGTVPLFFEHQFTRFADLAEDARLPERLE